MRTRWRRAGDVRLRTLAAVALGVGLAGRAAVPSPPAPLASRGPIEAPDAEPAAPTSGWLAQRRAQVAAREREAQELALERDGSAQAADDMTKPGPGAGGFLQWRRQQIAENQAKSQDAQPRIDTAGMLKVGDSHQGTVTRIGKYGAFVDIGIGKNGLLPKPKFFLLQGMQLKEGTLVQVWVSNIRDDGSFELTMRNPRGVKDMTRGKRLMGKVSKVMQYGVFVDVGVERDGLVPIALLTASDEGDAPDGEGDDEFAGFSRFDEDEQKEQKPREHNAETAHWPERGEEVEVWVSRVEEGVLQLSMRQIKEPRKRRPKRKEVVSPSNKDRDLSSFMNVSDEEWLKGTVQTVEEFGAFVLVQPPAEGRAAEGLVHKTQISADETMDSRSKYIPDVREVLEPGEEVCVRVIEIDTDAERGRMYLSMVTKQVGTPSRTGGKKEVVQGDPFPLHDPDRWYVGTASTDSWERGFGFITCNDSYDVYRRDIFLHKSEMARQHDQNGTIEVSSGDFLKFRVRLLDDMTLRATNITKIANAAEHPEAADRMARVIAFRNKYPMDDRAFDYLSKANPRAQAKLMSTFQHGPDWESSETGYSSAVTAMLNKFLRKPGRKRRR